MFPPLLQVTKKEPINGIDIASIRQYGVVDDQEVTSGANKEKVFLRISKPLLRIIVSELHVLEKILTGGKEALSGGLFPEGTDLGSLLRTCRRYDADTQEAVQLVSHLVAMHAWLVIEQGRPDAENPTLLTLRPGAKVLGSKDTLTRRLSFLVKAAAAVDVAGAGKEGSERTQKRLTAAFQHGVRLVPCTRTPESGTAALSKACGAGYDMVVKIGAITQYGQTKGRETGPAAGAGGGDAEVSPSQLVAVLNDLKKAAVEGGAELVRLELLFAGKASSGVQQILAGEAVNTDIADALAPRSCALVLMRAELDTALGSVFGGIAARCVKLELKSKMEAAGATAAGGSETLETVFPVGGKEEGMEDREAAEEESAEAESAKAADDAQGFDV